MSSYPKAACSEQCLYTALELSKKSWLLAILFPSRDNPSLLGACTTEAARRTHLLGCGPGSSANDHRAKS